MNRIPKIKVYKASDKLRNKAETVGYAAESIVRATTMYVLWDDEMAIIQDDVAIRIPMEQAVEIADLVEDIKDSKERGFFRERQRVHEGARL